jgi:hypothetical protein
VLLTRLARGMRKEPQGGGYAVDLFGDRARVLALPPRACAKGGRLLGARTLSAWARPSGWTAGTCL